MLLNFAGCKGCSYPLQAELFTLLEHEHLQEAAILIMANKQDLKDAMSVKEMTDVLSLHSLKRHDWHIQVRWRLLRAFQEAPCIQEHPHIWHV